MNVANSSLDEQLEALRTQINNQINAFTREKCIQCTMCVNFVKDRTLVVNAFGMEY